jgi:hypothetical protein
LNMPNFDIPAPTTATPLPSFLLFFMIATHSLFCSCFLSVGLDAPLADDSGQPDSQSREQVQGAMPWEANHSCHRKVGIRFGRCLCNRAVLRVGNNF